MLSDLLSAFVFLTISTSYAWNFSKFSLISWIWIAVMISCDSLWRSLCLVKTEFGSGIVHYLRRQISTAECFVYPPMQGSFSCFKLIIYFVLFSLFGSGLAFIVLDSLKKEKAPLCWNTGDRSVMIIVKLQGCRVFCGHNHSTWGKLCSQSCLELQHRGHDYMQELWILFRRLQWNRYLKGQKEHLIIKEFCFSHRTDCESVQSQHDHFN